MANIGRIWARFPRYFVVRAGEDLRRLAHRAFSLSWVVPIESTALVMRDGRLADAFDYPLQRNWRLVAPRRLPGKNGAPKVKLASARSGTMDCHRQFSSEEGECTTHMTLGKPKAILAEVSDRVGVHDLGTETMETDICQM
jgi:hypothetical protein